MNGNGFWRSWRRPDERVIAAGPAAGPAFIFTARHSPFEIAFLLMSVVSGVVNLIGGSTSPSLSAFAEALPWFLPAWGAGLIAGGICGLASVFMALPGSLIIERIGLSLLATLYSSYAVAVLFFAGGRGLGSGLLVLCVVVGSVLRILAIGRDIRLIGRAAAP